MNVDPATQKLIHDNRTPQVDAAAGAGGTESWRTGTIGIELQLRDLARGQQAVVELARTSVARRRPIARHAAGRSSPTSSSPASRRPTIGAPSSNA